MSLRKRYLAQRSKMMIRGIHPESYQRESSLKILLMGKSKLLTLQRNQVLVPQESLLTPKGKFRGKEVKK